MARLSRKEKAFVGLAEDAGLTYFVPTEMTTRRIANAPGIADNIQISYSFPKAIRRNTFVRRDGSGKGTYGVDGISFRLLYEFLCETFNSGEYFIDTYFNTIFDTRPVYDELEDLNESIIGDIEEEKAALLGEIVYRKDRQPDMRYRASKRYVALFAWLNPVRAGAASRVARRIQDDIVDCLATGRIPLRKSKVSASTLEKRERLIGLGDDKFFYASGQLIRSLQVYVELAEER